jgi:hypothetical protein
MRIRATVLAIVALVVTACGTPCSRIANAEAAANDKGKACNSSNTSWDTAHVSRCEAGLSQCSADDQKSLDTYADCLQKLPVCSQGQGLSWNLQRLSCTQSLVNVSGTCGAAIR